MIDPLQTKLQATHMGYNMLPSGFEPEITALKGQYAWPDYTIGA